MERGVGLFYIPPLRPGRPVLGALARRAVELLQKRIAEPDAPNDDVEVPFELVVRESTVGAPVA